MGGQSALSGESGQALADGVLAALEGFSVEYVMRLRSRFVIRTDDGGGPDGVEDVTAAGGAEGSLCLVDDRRKVILIARAALPPAVTPAYILAQVGCGIFTPTWSILIFVIQYLEF